MDGRTELSDRARAFLDRVGAVRDPDAGSEAALVVLAARGLLASQALRSFEATFGGLRFQWGRRRVVLGLAASGVEDDEPPGPDDTRVWIGREDEWTDLSMSADGRVWSHGPDETAWPLAPSPTRYLEHLALLADLETWCADPFRVALPPTGAGLAPLLGLTLDRLATDDHLAAWRGEAVHLLERFQGHPYATGFCELLCRDLEGVAHALDRLHRAVPDLAIGIVGPQGRVEQTIRRDGWARIGDQVPDPESWAHEPGAVRFEYLGDGLAFLGRPDPPGVVWLLGSPGARRIEQVVLAGTDDGVTRWDSHGPSRSISRLFLPIHPPDGAGSAG